MTRQSITEESGIHRDWAIEAKGMTLDALPEFIRKLTEDYEHDYGTICHAIAAGAIAAANSIQRSDQGGITGFQAGCVMWQMIDLWGVFGEGPKRMLNMRDMLYPQYLHKFRSISKETWEWLQAEAKKNLTEDKHNAHPDVLAHWETVAAGTVPFGYQIEGQ